MATFRIIAFDGGGVRGALSARIFLRVANKYPEISKHTHLFAGTSTGSFIALGLANNLSPEIIDNLYSPKNIKYVFSPRRPNIINPKYKNFHLEELLNSVFSKNLTLASLPKQVFIPAFNVKGYQSQGFNTVYLHNIASNPTIKEKVVDVALYSSAAPTYFPSYNDFIDGGLAINSPNSAPIIFIRSLYPHIYDLKDFRLLSIGTGRYPHRIDRNTTNWGVLQWLYHPLTTVKQPLSSILFNAPTELDDRYSRELIGKNFFSLNPILTQQVPLDDYKKVPYLHEVADTIDLTETFKYIERYFLSN